MDPLSFASSALLALAEGTGVEGEVSCVSQSGYNIVLCSSLKNQMVTPQMVMPPLQHQLLPKFLVFLGSLLEEKLVSISIHY